MSEAIPKKNRWWAWLMVPVGLGLGVWLGLGWWRADAPGDGELYVQYYVPHHLPVLPADSGGLVHWTDAAYKYQGAKYEEARLALLRAEKHHELPVSATQFYIGQCLMALGRPAEALPLFQDLMQIREAPHAALRWYMALCHLHAGNRAAAKDLLWEIEGDKGYKAGTATQLLEEMGG